MSSLPAPLRIDRADECVWRGTTKVRLTPKAFAVLGYLVDHAPRLARKEELIATLWPGIAVTDAALTVCIREIRRALGDDPRAPHLIETVHRRGYRFIGAPRAGEKETGARREPVPAPVEREAELRGLEERFRRAEAGDRQIVFVNGEPGIGKTTLVEAFTAAVGATQPVWIASGQCVAQHGGAEPYLPVLEALAQLCRGPSGDQALELLARFAPSWLGRMPAFAGSATLAQSKRLEATTRERVLREMADALEAMTSPRPLVLVLEDLHWSDPSTVDLVSLLANRRDPARLMLIGTYRPVDVALRDHPLRPARRELLLHGRCTEIPLRLLSPAGIREYLIRRTNLASASRGELARLARTIHASTEGSPLFMAHVVRDLEAPRPRGGRRRGGHGTRDGSALRIPDSLRDFIEQDVAAAPADERALLEAASVAGVEFEAALVAAALDEPPLESEARCDALAQRPQWLRAEGAVSWPDGTVTTRYRFSHALYQAVIYERVPAGRRAELHRRIAERLASAHGERASELAARLAMHFERGACFDAAAAWYERAAERALGRSAQREAIELTMRAERLLERTPKSAERSARHLAVMLTRSVAAMAAEGYASPKVEASYARARELSSDVGDAALRFDVLWGLCVFHHVRGEFRLASELATQLMDLAGAEAVSDRVLAARTACGMVSFHLGRLVDARSRLEEGIALYGSVPRERGACAMDRTRWVRSKGMQHPTELALRSGQDLGVTCHAYLSWALWLLGLPEEAAAHGEESLRLARAIAHPFTLGFALFFAAELAQFRRDRTSALTHGRELERIAADHGFPHWRAAAAIIRGGDLVAEGRGAEGIDAIRRGLAEREAIGTGIAQTRWLAELAEAYRDVGQPRQALAVVTEALRVVRRTGERYWEAEIWRLAGELTLEASHKGHPSAGTLAKARSRIKRAAAVASRQGAIALERRAHGACEKLARFEPRGGSEAAAERPKREVEREPRRRG